MDALKYQTRSAAASSDLATVKLRSKPPDSDASQLMLAPGSKKYRFVRFAYVALLAGFISATAMESWVGGDGLGKIAELSHQSTGGSR